MNKTIIIIAILVGLFLVSGIAGCSEKEKRMSQCSDMSMSFDVDLCYEIAAQELKDDSICESISTEEGITNCKNYVLARGILSAQLGEEYLPPLV